MLFDRCCWNICTKEKVTWSETSLLKWWHVYRIRATNYITGNGSNVTSFSKALQVPSFKCSQTSCLTHLWSYLSLLEKRNSTWTHFMPFSYFYLFLFLPTTVKPVAVATSSSCFPALFLFLSTIYFSFLLFSPLFFPFLLFPRHTHSFSLVAKISIDLQDSIFVQVAEFAGNKHLFWLVLLLFIRPVYLDQGQTSHFEREDEVAQASIQVDCTRIHSVWKRPIIRLR